MILIIILGFVILGFIIGESIESRPKAERKLVAYNTVNGQPIYLDQCRFIRYDTETGNPIFENPYRIVKYDSQTGRPICAQFEVDKSEYKDNRFNRVEVKKPLTEEDKNRLSNSILMIVGALLVVIASVIFLATSWESISGIIKTLVLVLVQGMFFLFGYLCKNKLKIEKVAKVFNYLALCFVPIVLISLSTFELIGSFLSIHGEGFRLYVTIVGIIADILYKVIGYYKKDKVCKIMSYVAEVGALFFITDYISNDALASTIVAVYNILISFLINKNILDKKAYKIPNNIFSYIALLLIVMVIIVNNGSLLVYIPMILYTIYYYIEYIKDTEGKVYNFVFFIITYVINLTLVNRIDGSPYFVYILSIMPLVLLTKTMKNKNSKNVLYIVESVVALLFIMFALATPNKTVYYLMTFIMGFGFYLMMYVLTKQPIYKGAAYLLFTSIFIDIFYISDILDYAKYIPLVVVILIYLFENVFDEFKDRVSMGLIIAILILESFWLIQTYFVLAPLVLMLAYIKLEKLDETLLVIPMLTSLTLFGMNDNIITLALSYILISIYTVMSLLHKKFNIYSVASVLAIVMAAIVFKYKDLILFAILLVWSIVHLVRNSKEKNYLFKFVNIISVLGLYVSTLRFFDIDLIALYLVGYYIATIAISVYVLKDIGGDFDKFAGCFVFAIISLVSLFIVKEIPDALILIIFFFLVSLISFVVKWRHYLYEALIIMIVNIIYLTIEFWAQIPWYFYILAIGMGLIIFAMFDERFKQKKELKGTNEEAVTQIPVNVVPVNNEVGMPEVNTAEVEEPVPQVKEEVLEENKVVDTEEKKQEEKEEEVKRNTPKRRGRRKKTDSKTT